MAWGLTTDAPNRGMASAIRFGLLALAAYAVVLVATLPARVVLQAAGAAPLAQEASGSVWNGAVGLGQGNTVLWSVAPFRSLGELALATDLTVDGPQTALTGRVRWRPGALTFDGVAGRAGWPLVAALAPDLPMSCDAGIGVDLRTLVVAGRRSSADGKLTSGVGTCRSRTGSAAQVPALVVTATMDGGGSRAWMSPLTSPGVRLAEAALSRDGAVTAAIHPAGAVLLPAGALAGSLTLETRL